MACIAAHSDGCSALCSNNIRTARARNSGEYLLFGLLIRSFSQEVDPPINPGRFKLRFADRGATLPMTFGHEVAGEVVAVGDAVTDVAVGQSV
ncbi:MAG: alcohol dehydrogenase catalytic domain-containing protein, partial [Thiolinea sp.]